MSTMRDATLGVVLATALLTTGCARGIAPASAELAGAPVTGAATLIVRNDNVAGMDVALVRDDEIVARLGLVDAQAAATFAINPLLIQTGPLGLMARPIGGSGIARCGPIPVTAGQTVTFTIPPDLLASVATLR